MHNMTLTPVIYRAQYKIYVSPFCILWWKNQSWGLSQFELDCIGPPSDVIKFQATEIFVSLIDSPWIDKWDMKCRLLPFNPLLATLSEYLKAVFLICRSQCWIKTRPNIYQMHSTVYQHWYWIVTRISVTKMLKRIMPTKSTTTSDMWKLWEYTRCCTSNFLFVHIFPLSSSSLQFCLDNSWIIFITQSGPPSFSFLVNNFKVRQCKSIFILYLTDVFLQYPRSLMHSKHALSPVCSLHNSFDAL